jgi:hypothetical protein
MSGFKLKGRAKSQPPSRHGWQWDLDAGHSLVIRPWSLVIFPRLLPLAFSLCVLIFTPTLCARDRWTAEQAWAWQKTQPWLVGANFIPSTAINQLEMFQADTFDEATIDRELGYAAALGFTSMRVFLHDLLWLRDSEGFLKRLDRTLELAAKHRIGLMPVLFDSCWDPLPKLGKQPAPAPRVHNSGWLQSPGVDVLRDPAKQAHLEAYVRGVVGRFRNDPRVQVWDLWNEPANRDGQQFRRPGTEMDPKEKERVITALLPQVFRWARECNPVQPLTTAPWRPILPDGSLHPIEKLQVELSDVVSFHCYAPPAKFREVADAFAKFGRPLLCTEYGARPQSTFDPILGIMKERSIGAYCWGFVAGKIQTQFSLRWDPAKTPDDPPLWLNDVLRPDGTPHRPAEADYIRSLTRPARASP